MRSPCSLFRYLAVSMYSRCHSPTCPRSICLHGCTACSTALPADCILAYCSLQSSSFLTALMMPADGAGIYVLYEDGRNVRLLYELEVPIYPQEAQEVLAIYKTGDYSVQVRVRSCLCLPSPSISEALLSCPSTNDMAFCRVQTPL